jgi:hypothetical protein
LYFHFILPEKDYSTIFSHNIGLLHPVFLLVFICLVTT